jgi:hypothetical protein
MPCAWHCSSVSPAPAISGSAVNGRDRRGIHPRAFERDTQGVARRGATLFHRDGGQVGTEHSSIRRDISPSIMGVSRSDLSASVTRAPRHLTPELLSYDSRVRYMAKGVREIFARAERVDDIVCKRYETNTVCNLRDGDAI